MSLLDKYEVFKNFLNSNNIRYAEDTLEHGDKFFRIPQTLGDNKVVEVLVIFAKQSIKILIVGIATIDSEEKKAACYKLFNEFAIQYSFFKFYIRPNGDVNVEGDAVLGVVEGEFQTKGLMGFIVAAVNLLQKVYGDIVKIQQS